MTEKQENILKAALALFTSEGYHATSTSKVAKHAKVSEGLIFRHFGSKEGLLEAIIQMGEEAFKSLMVNVVMETDPKEVLRRAIALPFHVSEDQKEFWKLQFKLKWEMEISGAEKMEPLMMALANAFGKLGYENPELEAAFFAFYLDGVASAILKGVEVDADEMQSFLLKKYNL